MQLALYFKALADGTRLRLLNMLFSHELNVNEIVSIMGMGQSRVSRHLKILTDCGLLKHRRDGLWVFYSVNMEGPAGGLLDIIANLIRTDPEISEDFNKLAGSIEEGYRQRTRFFDSLAPEWNGIRQGIFGDFNISEEIAGRIRKCEVAADLGCGTGELLPYIRQKAKRVIGVDRSPKMLEVASRRQGLNGRGIELRIGEIEHLPMRDREANAAVFNMVLHHLPYPDRAIMEAGRVVSENGSLIIADLEKHRNEQMRAKYGHRWLGFARKTVERWLEDAGFSLSEFVQFEVKSGLTVDLFVSMKK